jgi:large subunit ribosomal protein L13
VQQKINYVDGKDKVLGRVASQVAKMLLNGNRVVLLNAERLFVSGHVTDLMQNYKHRIELKDKSNPNHSPYWSRRPDLFVKRTIRGMLPYKKPRGKSAFKLLRVYTGVPEEYKNVDITEIKSKTQNQIFEKTMSVADLVKKLGYNR